MEATTKSVPEDVTPSVPERHARDLRLAKIALCVIVPTGIWLAPLGLAQNQKVALMISAFMIVGWMTEVIGYATTGMLGLTLFWLFKVTKPEVVFGGFTNDATWFYLGAMLIGAMTMKSSLPLRIANIVISRVGVSYSRLLLGLIIVDFLLTFIVPNGAAIVVIMASIAMGIIKIFGVQKGSNIGRGIFLVLTYTTSIFNKMIVAGPATMISRAIILHIGGVKISWVGWLVAFFPCVIGTILVSWWLTLRMFPPEADGLAGRQEQLKEHFSNVVPWTVQATKASILSGLALVLYLMEPFDHISAPLVSLGIGLIALLPFVELLTEDDIRAINLMPFFLSGAALGMSDILEKTGVLGIVSNSFVNGITPVLSHKLGAVIFLYWSGFFYHFVTAHEVSMLATSMPILMEFSKTHHENPLWIGMVWSFSSGGKLFAYQSSVLVIGYGYGYFRHTDLLKLGLILTVVEFLLLLPCVLFYWPLLGLG
jgi:sodium-dependent dicarboxylate transporter 2/3/5